MSGPGGPADDAVTPDATSRERSDVERQPRIIRGQPLERDARPDALHADASARSLDREHASVRWVDDEVFAVTLLAAPDRVPIAITTRATGAQAVDAVFQPAIARGAPGAAAPYAFHLRLPAGIDAELPVRVTVRGLGDPVTVVLAR